MRALQHRAGAAGSSSLALVRRADNWSGLRESNPTSSAWKAEAQPLDHARSLRPAINSGGPERRVLEAEPNLRLRRGAIALSAALVLILSLLPLAAQAHGDAAWIMDNPDSNVRRCCGPQDCSRISKDAVRIETGGVRIIATDELIPYDFPGLFASIDQDWWRCTVDYWAPGASAAVPRTRCLFYPGNS